MGGEGWVGGLKNLVIALCMCSVQVYPLPGPIKWNRPCVIIQLVLQNPVTNVQEVSVT